jgi:uncharacterized membrane protein
MKRIDPDRGADRESDHPALAKVIEKNIRTIIQLRLQAEDERSLESRAADAVTAFSGSMVFVYLHIAWFAIWVVLNTGWVGMPAFDPFPYGLLTMVVSLEAIFLSTLVLITQNRLAAEGEHRADLNLQTSLLTEHELTRVLQMLSAIQDKLGIKDHAASELAELEVETKPEDVMAEIERLHRAAIRQREPAR